MALCQQNGEVDIMKNVLKAVERMLMKDEDKQNKSVDKPATVFQNTWDLKVSTRMTSNMTNHPENDFSDVSYNLVDEKNFHGISVADAKIMDCRDCDFFENFGFTKKKSIGKGASGEVFKVVSDSDPSNVKAVKIFSFIKQSCDFDYEEMLFKKEVAILQSIDHKHILHDFSAHQCLCYGVIEMDFYQEGTLRDVFTHRPQQILDIYFVQLACAVRYMHKQRIVHRDIKLENVLIRGEDAVLIDFGFAQRLPVSNMLHGQLGTRNYMAPEVRYREEGAEYDGIQADAFSLGVVLWALLTRQTPARETKYRRELKQHRENIDVAVYSASFSLLRCDPHRRVNVCKVLSYLRDNDWNATLIDEL